MNKDILIDINTKLTIEEQKHYLYELLGFVVNNDGVIYDEDGTEFYGYDINDRHELTTLKGIMEYYAFCQVNYELNSFKRKVKLLFE